MMNSPARAHYVRASVRAFVNPRIFQASQHLPKPWQWTGEEMAEFVSLEGVSASVERGTEL
jgi:hypothetical protein